jgi:hypothetical protein
MFFKDDVNISEFESNCGVGVVITPAQVEQAVELEINKVGPTITLFYSRYNKTE